MYVISLYAFSFENKQQDVTCVSAVEFDTRLAEATAHSGYSLLL